MFIGGLNWETTDRKASYNICHDLVEGSYANFLS